MLVMQHEGERPIVVLQDGADGQYCPHVRVRLLRIHEMKRRVLVRISVWRREINPDLLRAKYSQNYISSTKQW